VQFDVALLTNLTRDHLDYHGDMQGYSAAKRRLFDWKSLKYAVVNLDDVFGGELALRLREKEVEVVGYGLTDAALQLAGRHGLRMVKGHTLEMSGQGMRLSVHSSWGVAEINSGLIGRFNAANLLGALAVLLVSDVSLNQAVSSLSRVQSVAGRMQKVGKINQPAVIVDYAHTPDALEKVLMALRELCDADQRSGRLICLFGCGGDRDRGKRAMMGLVAEKFADHCIVTSDNPRSEDPQGIISEIVTGMTEQRHEVIEDREVAIQHAIGMAKEGDIVLLAGKGHENYQEIHGVKHEFSDVDMAVKALNKCAGGIQ
jgi:UDP-N-acetylmuramoyl-L-alanyl-D-glutamate--2,6-diaminopimelate ligase